MRVIRTLVFTLVAWVAFFSGLIVASIRYSVPDNVPSPTPPAPPTCKTMMYLDTTPTNLHHDLEAGSEQYVCFDKHLGWRIP